MALDLSTDYLIIDDPIDIVFKSKSSPLDFAPGVTIPWSQKEENVRSIAEPGTDLRHQETYFTLWRGPAETAGLTVAPKRNDVITYGGHDWTVISVEDQDLDMSGLPQRWRLFSRSEP